MYPGKVLQLAVVASCLRTVSPSSPIRVACGDDENKVLLDFLLEVRMACFSSGAKIIVLFNAFSVDM